MEDVVNPLELSSIPGRLDYLRGSLPSGVRLLAVSKFHPVEAVMQAYDWGQRLFGENRPQELSAKAPRLPSDIQWHFLGHLQTNKLRMVLPWVELVQSIDSEHLLGAVCTYVRNGGTIRHPETGRVPVLLELHLGAEVTKGGFSEEEILDVVSRRGQFPEARFCGLMGMATNTTDEAVVDGDFARIESLFHRIREMYASDPLFLRSFRELSIGMSSDYVIAVRHSSTIVRIGTSIFGERDYGAAK